MEVIEFTNSDTAAAYEALTDVDHWLDVPGRRDKGEQCWKGNFSDITPEAAARLVRWGYNHIKAKEAVADPE